MQNKITVPQQIARFNPSVEKGLSNLEVAKRTKSGLTNKTKNKTTRSNFAILKDYVFTLFNFFNVAIGVLLAVARHFSSLLFLVVVLLNIIVGVVQELRGRALVNRLSILIKKSALVMRDGKVKEIDSREIVLDDILFLSSGEQVACDCIVKEGSLEVNEALLTGEADAVIKNPGDTLLSGSFVVSGKCTAKADKVGESSFSARLSSDAKKHKAISSQLVNSMRKITRLTSIFVVPIGVGLFLQAFFLHQGLDWRAAIPGASAALLGMLPRGLMLLISIAFATAVIRLSRKKILVQDPFSCENLARANILCLDKTGTLTTGEMSVKDFISFDNRLTEMLEVFLQFSSDNNQTSAALRQRFSKEEKSLSLISETPFSSDRKYSAVCVKGVGTIFVGAPEALGVKPSHKGISATDRVLAVCFSEKEGGVGALDCVKCLGLIIIEDPIRKGAKEALKYFRNNGVVVKVISGDNPQTVSAIALKAGLENGHKYTDLSKVLTDKQLIEAAKEYTVFGRVSPTQKKKLIEIFKYLDCEKPKTKKFSLSEFFSLGEKKRNTVAMVGDGVNDILALKEADCSVSLANGSGAAKGVSGMILLDSSFTTLPEAVSEGRRVVHSITRAGGIFFIKTIYSVLLSVLLLILRAPFPFYPFAITIIDLAIEGYPSLLLSFQKQNKPIEGSFIQSSFLKALPNAMVVVLAYSVCFIMFRMGILSLINANTIAFLALGAISAAAVFRALWPFNKFRIFILISSGVGFFLAVWLLSSGLGLILNRSFNPMNLHLSPSKIWIAALVSTISIAILAPLSIAIKTRKKKTLLTNN